MLTPQEVSERAFAKASFGGYNMAMVDEFLDALTEDYGALYKENTALKAKMKILVEKVEEYRATEDAMRKALLTAQTMADEMVRDAERKQAQLLTNAENEARERIAEIRQEIAQEENRRTAAQNATTVYVGKLRELHKRELDYLNSLDALGAATPKAQPRREDQVVAAVAEIEASMNRMMEEDEDRPQPPVAPQREPEFENPFVTPPQEEDVSAVVRPHVAPPQEEDTLSFARPTAPAPQEEEVPGRIDLDDLQFGKDFDL